jgi:hypothetical protein
MHLSLVPSDMSGNHLLLVFTLVPAVVLALVGWRLSEIVHLANQAKSVSEENNRFKASNLELKKITDGLQAENKQLKFTVEDLNSSIDGLEHARALIEESAIKSGTDFREILKQLCRSVKAQKDVQERTKQILRRTRQFTQMQTRELLLNFYLHLERKEGTYGLGPQTFGKLLAMLPDDVARRLSPPGAALPEFETIDADGDGLLDLDNMRNWVIQAVRDDDEESEPVSSEETQISSGPSLPLQTRPPPMQFTPEATPVPTPGPSRSRGNDKLGVAYHLPADRIPSPQRSRRSPSPQRSRPSRALSGSNPAEMEAGREGGFASGWHDGNCQGGAARAPHGLPPWRRSSTPSPRRENAGSLGSASRSSERERLAGAAALNLHGASDSSWPLMRGETSPGSPSKLAL